MFIIAALSFAFLIGANAERSLLDEVLWARATGYAIGVLLIPALIAVFAFGRKGNWPGFSKCLFGLAVLMGSLSYQNRQRRPVDAKVAIIELLKQATGQRPITDSTSAEKALREFFVEVLAKRKSYDSAREIFYKNSELLQPASYSSITSIRSEKGRIDALLQADDEFKRFYETGFVQLAKRAAEGTNWSSNSQIKFMNGLQGSFNAAIYVNAVNAEIEWLKACRGLYDAAEANFSSIRVVRGQVVITETVVRQEFNAMIERINQLSADVKNSEAALRQKQKDIESAIGASQNDLGIK
jgi:hypothetical protein